MRNQVDRLRISLCLSFFLFLVSNSIFSQNFFGKTYQHIHDEQCAAVHIENMQEEQLGFYGSRAYFESWIEGAIEDERKNPRLRIQNEIRQIPVVIHVIHTGTSVGTGANISVEQIERQIQTLNEDFRRENPDAAQTPPEFLNVAADSRIEFVLARQDPRGLPTNGINRVEGTKNSYSPNDAGLIGQIALWPPEDYLNIWVVPLNSPFIGYASFPIADLDGLNFPANTRETDGVTVDYRYFGEGGAAVGSSRGRTLTHEVGHFLGLRHIWGDGDCNADDFVADTPRQDSPNNICRLGQPRFTCDSRDMTENYMDYTTDACMNIFTQGQAERFDVVLANSPRRASLVNGRGIVAPVLLENDLALEKLITPQDFICELQITPEVQVFNIGSNQVTSATIRISNNGTVLQTQTVSLNLATGESARISFAPITLNPSNNNFEVRIMQVNNTTDPNPANNVATSNPVLQPELTLPYTFDFNDLGNHWVIRNDDDGFTWQETQVTLDGTPQQAIFIRNYEYEAQGELDFLISPQINLSENPNAQLTFKVAHAPYNSQGFTDFLLVAVSTDCGNTFNLVDAPYNKDRTFLQTSEPTLNEFIPTSENQFRREIVNLSQFADLGNVRIAFVARNGYGNNIFIKDIEILEEEEFNYNVVIRELISPQPISNGEHEQETVQIENTGNLPISSFLFRRRSNSTTAQTFIARGAILAPGEIINVNLPKSTNPGLNRLIYTLENPNFDQNPRETATLERFVIINEEFIRAPWRQDFNNTPNLQPWISLNPENNLQAWVLSPLQSAEPNSNVAKVEISAAENSFWLGSPVFDLSISSQASVFFDRAAGNVSEGTTLKVLASDDGGVSYEEVYRKSGTDLTTTTGDPNPNSPDDFVREFINLTDYAGPNKKKVRLAFVLEQGVQPNNPVFLNNIELFLSANPEPVNPGLGNTIIYPNPAVGFFNIVFNLDRFETVNIQIFSPTGALVHDVDYPGTLNQTFTFSNQLFSKGLFIVKITSQSITETRKLILQ